MISADDFKDKATMNLIDTCSIYLSIITVYQIFFTDPLSNKYLFYKGRRVTFPAMRSETAGTITVRKMV